jgi:uncharacterized protein YqjF (DUF2071 family)
MSKTILQSIAHRPWPLPAGRWAYYQEWNRALFLHWRVPVAHVQELLPPGLQADTINGDAWVSLVAFTMEHIRPAGLPALSQISDFDEINLRTYVTQNGKAGVYFLNIEAGKAISAYVARRLSGLPYEKATIQRTRFDGEEVYISVNPAKNFKLAAFYETGAPVQEKTPLDLWLTERYCLYQEAGPVLRCYDIHHLPWPLEQVTLANLQTAYKAGGIDLARRKPDLVHYSPGVKVLAWKATVVSGS